MDDRMALLSSSLIGQIKDIIAHDRPDDPNYHYDTVLPGQAELKPVPEPPQPQAKFRWRTSERLESEGGTAAQESGLAHVQVRHSYISPPSAQPPQHSGGGQSVPFSQGGPKGNKENFYDDDRVDDDENDVDDRDTLAEAPVDRAFANLIQYIYECFLHAVPQTAAPAAPRCDYESYFAMADPPEPSRQLMRLYLLVSEIQTAASDYAANLAWESRPLFKLLPSKRRSLSIGDAPNFCKQRFLNADFSRSCRSESVPRSRMASVSLADLEWLDRATRMVLVGDSQSFWFLSSLLSQLKEDGYRPSNPSLFDKSISSLSAALAAQTGVAASVSEFITAKRRESYLSQASFTLPESLKRELLVAPAADSLLFNQPLLSTAIENMKEASLLSSTSSLASISKAALKSNPSGGPGAFKSPLDTSRVGPSGFRKCSASPYGRRAKRSRDGKGVTPSSTRGRGFRR